MCLQFKKVHAGLDEKHNEPGLIYWHGDIAQPKIAITFDDGSNVQVAIRCGQFLDISDYKRKWLGYE